MASHMVVAPGQVTTLGAAEIDNMAWQPVPGCPGVSAKVLAFDSAIAGALIAYQPQASTPGRAHPVDQYIWVFSGEACIAGRWLAAGSAAHVPAGAAHPVTGGSGDGCTLLQVQAHRPT
jgi:quercetin dioxygenase-like cupin family protein